MVYHRSRFSLLDCIAGYTRNLWRNSTGSVVVMARSVSSTRSFLHGVARPCNRIGRYLAKWRTSPLFFQRVTAVLVVSHMRGTQFHCRLMCDLLWFAHIAKVYCCYYCPMLHVQFQETIRGLRTKVHLQLVVTWDDENWTVIRCYNVALLFCFHTLKWQLIINGHPGRAGSVPGCAGAAECRFGNGPDTPVVSCFRKQNLPVSWYDTYGQMDLFTNRKLQKLLYIYACVVIVWKILCKKSYFENIEMISGQPGIFRFVKRISASYYWLPCTLVCRLSILWWQSKNNLTYWFHDW